MTARQYGLTPAAAHPRLVGHVTAPDLHLMSWNIRRPVPAVFSRAADRWASRAPRLRAMLEAEQPTVLCAQEVLDEQARVVLAALGDDYRAVGRGRSADGGGEACPIFYDSDRLQLLDWTQLALSDTPDQPGSMSWGNLFPRVVIRAEFRDRATSRRVQVVNTHLDPLSARSRVRSARAILELVTASDTPTVITGDLNAGPSSAAVRELLSTGALRDSWVVADERLTEPWGTYANYREPRPDGTRIDWILATSLVRVTHAAINPFMHLGGWASDHLPVQAVVRLDTDDTNDEQAEEGDTQT